jgi:hypothetical protein
MDDLFLIIRYYVEVQICIKIMQFTIDDKLHYLTTGTDGRPIICK